MTLPTVPRMPERYGIAYLPADVAAANSEAQDALHQLALARTPQAEEARNFQAARIAAANKILAAYNPGLIVWPGGE
ncbi:hypothetical protein ACXZ65_34435 [Streptomyces aculeolatus]